MLEAPAPVAVPRAGRSLWLIAPGSVGFVALLVLVRRNRTDAIDAALTLRWQAVRNPLLERAMAVVSWFGFPPQSRVIPPVVAAGLWLGRLRLESAMLIGAWSSALLSTVIKGLMRRPRPVAGTDLRVAAAPLGGTSFPSGHVLTYTTLYGWLAVVAEVAIRPAWLRRAVIGALALLIGGVGPSRIHLGHHWPSDVAASYLLGSSQLAGLVVLYRALKARGVLQ